MSQLPLSGAIALVTGASRGAGRGIAVELGAAGATVYVTGRTTRVTGASPDRPGTIEDAAEAVTAAGGRGIPVRCDHTDDADTAELIARIRAESGGIDVLVNNAWGGHGQSAEAVEETTASRPFWEHSLANWDRMFTQGVRNHCVLARHAIPLMLGRGRGLVVTTTAWDQDRYTGHFYYDLAKNALNRMAYTMGLELRPHGIASLAVAPGWMRTELVLAAFSATEETWRDVPDLATTESPRYLGRAVAALAADPEVMRHVGRNPLRVGDLARLYGFTDLDGRQPEPWELPAEMALD